MEHTHIPYLADTGKCIIHFHVLNFLGGQILHHLYKNYTYYLPTALFQPVITHGQIIRTVLNSCNHKKTI